jgi:predicted PurR-regulated permease PerM
MEALSVDKKVWLQLALVALLLLGILTLVGYFINVFGYVLLAVVTYFIIRPVVDKLKSWGLSNVQSFCLIMFAFLLFIFAFYQFGVPAIEQEVGQIASDWPSIEKRVATELLQPKQLEDGTMAYFSPVVGVQFSAQQVASVQDTLNTFLDSILSKVLPALLQILLLVPIIMFIIVNEGEEIKQWLVSLIPNKYFETLLAIGYDINKSLSNFVTAKLVQTAIVTVFTGVWFYFTGLKLPFILAIILGLANIIPYVGPLIGAIPPVLFGYLFGDVQLAGIVFLGIVIAQLLDNMIVQPFLLPKLLNEHPLVVLLVTLLGAELFGAIGLLLAQPVFSISRIVLANAYKALVVINSRSE